MIALPTPLTRAIRGLAVPAEMVEVTSGSSVAPNASLYLRRLSLS